MGLNPKLHQNFQQASKFWNLEFVMQWNKKLLLELNNMYASKDGKRKKKKNMIKLCN